jgi:hypothetical protein
MALAFGPYLWPCPRLSGVRKGENCDNTRKTEWHQYGHLGTTDGTVFRACSGTSPVRETGALQADSTHLASRFRVVTVPLQHPDLAELGEFADNGPVYAKRVPNAEFSMKFLESPQIPVVF